MPDIFAVLLTDSVVLLEIKLYRILSSLLESLSAIIRFFFISNQFEETETNRKDMSVINYFYQFFFYYLIMYSKLYQFTGVYSAYL